MRIVKLTAAVEKQLLRARQQRDVPGERVAAGIVADVRRRGDSALFAWTKKLDGIDLADEGVWISRREIHDAAARVRTDFLQAVGHAAKNVRQVAEKQLPRPWTMEVEPGVSIGQVVRPIETVGCYIPGGRRALVSTLVMTAVPAKVAGVKRVVVVCPRPNAELLAAASLLGVAEIARIGGAQAIAAMAYGTKSVPRVEKIFGPGNRYVTAAKQLVSRRLRHRSARRPHRSNCFSHAGRSAVDRRGPACTSRARAGRGQLFCDDVEGLGGKSASGGRGAIAATLANESRSCIQPAKRGHRARAVHCRGL